jgi:hypothetical protein
MIPRIDAIKALGEKAVAASRTLRQRCRESARLYREALARKHKVLKRTLGLTAGPK